jgi:hypothetical protein
MHGIPPRPGPNPTFNGHRNADIAQMRAHEQRSVRQLVNGRFRNRRLAEDGVSACSDATGLVRRAWEGTASLPAKSICIEFPELPRTPRCRCAYVSVAYLSSGTVTMLSTPQLRCKTRGVIADVEKAYLPDTCALNGDAKIDRFASPAED